MTNDTTFKIGIVGTVVTALCCFTPVLVVLLGAIGLSAIVGMLDFILLPALALFIIITICLSWLMILKIVYMLFVNVVYSMIV